MEAMTKILNDAKVRPITLKISDEFNARFARLESLSQIESIKLAVESSIEQIRGQIETYIESQRFVLEKTSNMVKNTEDLKLNIGGIQTALKGIEYLAQFGGESVKYEAKKIMDEAVKQLEVSLPRIFEGMTGRNVLKFNSSES